MCMEGTVDGKIAIRSALPWMFALAWVFCLVADFHRFPSLHTGATDEVEKSFSKSDRNDPLPFFINVE